VGEEIGRGNTLTIDTGRLPTSQSYYPITGIQQQRTTVAAGTAEHPSIQRVWRGLEEALREYHERSNLRRDEENQYTRKIH